MEGLLRHEWDDLLEKYFGDIPREAAIDKPQILETSYNNELPRKVEEEFAKCLEEHWKEWMGEDAPSSRKIKNQEHLLGQVDNQYAASLAESYRKATEVTLWEKVTRTNNRDIIEYKSLLKQYCEDLLSVMIEDFLFDVE